MVGKTKSLVQDLRTLAYVAVISDILLHFIIWTMNVVMLIGRWSQRIEKLLWRLDETDVFELNMESPIRRFKGSQCAFGSSN